jgi:hypothetical protein
MSLMPFCYYSPAMDQPVGRTLADRVAAAQRDLFVGRERELALFRDALVAPDPPFAVLAITGPGGVGKSTLLRQFAHLAAGAGATPIVIDGHTVDPTPAAFLAAAGPGGGAPRRDRMVILVDHWERLQDLEGWLFTSFAPALPASALLVVAGRVVPAGALEADGAWGPLVRHVRLGNLDHDDAESLLARRGLPPAFREQAVRLSHGHPLALGLLADLGRDRDIDLSPGLDSMPELVARLLRVFVAGVPSERHLSALEVCAHVRVTTEPLLASVLGDEAARETFGWLRGLSFIEAGPEGLAPHDLARDALDADLFWRNRQQYAELHHRVRGHVIEQIASRRGDARLAAVFDFFYLHRRSEIGRLLFSWRFGAGVHHRLAEPREFDAIEDLVRQYEGPVSAAIARFWMGRQPGAFRVFLDAQGDVMGVFAELILPGIDAAAREADPIIDRIHRYCRAQGGLDDGSVLAVGRFFVIDGAYQEVSPHMDVIEAVSFLDWVGIPGLHWAFVLATRPEYWDARLAYIDLTRRPELDTELDGRRYAVYGHDWRAFPPGPWLAFMEARELGEPVGASPVAVPGITGDEFRAAVKRALRDFTRPDLLATNPLVERPFLAAHGEGSGAAALAACLRDAIDSLGSHPRDERLRRVLLRTFVTPAPSQEAAAEALDLPFSTYRRYLATGIDRVGAILWRLDAEHRGLGQNLTSN